MYTTVRDALSYTPIKVRETYIIQICFCVFFLLTLHIRVYSQDFSNRGRDFWVGYGNHVKMLSPNQTNAQEMVLYITSTQNANFTIDIPGTGWSWSSSVAANSVITSPPIPKSGAFDARLTDEGLYNRGIHVTSDRAIVAYTHIYNQNVSGATVLFPTNVLGIDYYSINFTQRSNEPDSYSYFYAVATEDNTVLEITPSALTKGGRPANVPFQVTLMKGQVYNVLSGNDLTGSRIRSISTGTTTCKKIAVFSGTGKIYIACSSGQTTSDNIMQQAFPAGAWGKKYLTAPTKNLPNNFFRVAVNDPATNVLVNRVPLTGLQNNFYYEFQSGQPNIIESDQPIMVAQYITTQSECGNNLIGADGDPEMIYLSPVEQTIDNITLNSTPNYQITSHYINVLLKTNTLTSFRLDGQPATASFTPHPVDPAYSYAQLTVGSGPHTLRADSGFNAIAYGYGNVESYGYNAGANVIDLYQFITLTNANASTNTASACQNLPFSIKLTLPYQPTSIQWEIPLNPTVIDNSPVYSETFVKNGKQLYVYELPGTYVYSAEGVYSLKVSAFNPTGQGCSGLQEIEYDFKVYPKPVAGFTATNLCSSTNAGFTDASQLDDRTAIKWYWDFGDNTTSGLQQPVHQYGAAQSYNVRYAVMTDAGCISDTITKPVMVIASPIAVFGMKGNLCAKENIQFSDSSALHSSVPIKQWSWDLGEGSPITTNTPPLPFTHTYLSPGTYTAKLVVTSTQNCASQPFEQQFIIHDLPKADFQLPTAVCLPSGTAQFNDLSTNPDAPLPLVYKWHFGDINATPANKDSSDLQNPAHIYSTSSTYSVSLSVTTANGCKADTTKDLSSVIEQAKAGITVTQADICEGGTISFTDNSNTKGRSLSSSFWDFDNGAVSAALNATQVYPSPDTFFVKHAITTIEGCTSDTVTTTVIVHPEPVANFNIISSRCELKETRFADASLISWDKVSKWVWNFGDNMTATIDTIDHVYPKWGDYTVTLEVESDKGCKSKPVTQTTHINPKPVAAFELPEACLADAFAVFTNSSHIADQTEAQFSYLWDFGDTHAVSPGTSTVSNGAYHYSLADNYSVKLITSSGSGCADTLSKSFTLNGSNPSANFTISNGTSVCNDQTVSIENHSSVDFGTITKVEIYWDANDPLSLPETDDSPVPSKTYQHVYATVAGASANRLIKLRAWSGGSCVSEMTKTITVNAIPQLAFSQVPGACLDAATFPITQASEINNLPGTGSFSGPGITTTGFNPGLAGVGDHTILYIYTSAAGCTAQKEQTIRVWPLPEISFAIQGLQCEKDSVYLQANSIDGQIIATWNWNFNDGTIPSTTIANTIRHLFQTTGAYEVALQATTVNGCSNPIKPVKVNINPLPVADFSSPKICLPHGTSYFTNLSSIADGSEGQFSYLWNFGDAASGNNNTSIEKNPTHHYSSTGPFTVSLTVTSGQGCSSVKTTPLRDVFNSPVAAFAAIDETCAGSVISFDDQSSDNEKPITTWHWNFGDQSTSTIENPSHQFAQPRTFRVGLAVTNSEGCVSDTFYKNIRVNPYPVVNAGPDLVILEGEGKIINATANGVNMKYKWDPPAYLSSDTSLTPRVTPADDSRYQLTVTGQGNCQSADYVSIKVLKLPKVPNTFTPNGDGINDTWEIKYLVTYPNCIVEVYNTQGQLLFHSTGYTRPWDGSFNGRQLPAGTYYYVIDPKEGRKKISGYITILR